MKIDDFVLENWLNPACDSEKNQIYLGGSCVLPMTVRELFDLTGESLDDFLRELADLNLGYSNFAGTPRLRRAIAGLYQNAAPEDVVLVHGGTGANNTVVMTLLAPGDSIAAIMPNYQQFYSIPRSIGVNVRRVDLQPEAGYRLDTEQLRRAVTGDCGDGCAQEPVKAILFTNPNNPTGALIELEQMREIVAMAREADAWIVCDEMYRGLKEDYMVSFADLYEKAVVTCSSSKIYSMAGTRVGWIICQDTALRQALFNRRSYDSICGGVFDEWIFAIALEHADKLYARSRQIVSANKAVIDRWLDGHPYLHQYAEAWGTTYLIHYDLDVDAETFCNGLLDQKGVLVCHGDCFYLPHTFRLSLSHAHNLEKGLQLIDEYIEELAREK